MATKKATAKAKNTRKTTAAKPTRVTKTAGTAKIIDSFVTKNGGTVKGLERGKILEKMQKDLDMTPGQSSTYYHNYLRENFSASTGKRLAASTKARKSGGTSKKAASSKKADAPEASA